ncbi:hypothetical protein MNBD_ALPHA03-1995 [hydrothermal vent metagenome]|uniref:Phytase-like domain-containing protein n=1 Tax=hydrothermal vent metagenome TaxID=652676 RepID=A0A3B1BLI4_9ZZZZ
MAVLHKKKINFYGIVILFVTSVMTVAHADSVKPMQIQKHNGQVQKQNRYAIPLSATFIPLNHQDAAITTVGRLHYLGGLKITSSNRQFGGISSFVVSPDGRQILGVSDSSRWFVADMIYNDNNHLIDIKNAHMAPIKNLDGPQKSNALDAEAITAVDGAGFVVSFESPHTLRYFQASRPFEYNSLFSAVAQKVNFAPELPRAYASLPRNLGIEALTTLPDGRMLAFSEETTSNGGIEQARGWIIGHGKIEPLRYETSASYRPTDMATLPNGDILVLERHFSLAKGMAARLTRLPALSIEAGQSVKGKIIADLAFPFNLDNMEALAVRQNDRGETVIYIMSDNNYNRLQRNILMMFKMDAPIKKAADKINGLNRILAGSN